MSKTLTPDQKQFLKSIVEAVYCAGLYRYRPQSVMRNNELDVSSATIRNEMMRLKQEGYYSSRILRPAVSLRIRATVIM